MTFASHYTVIHIFNYCIEKYIIFSIISGFGVFSLDFFFDFISIFMSKIWFLHNLHYNYQYIIKNADLILIFLIFSKPLYFILKICICLL